MTQRHKASKCYWENGAEGHVQFRIATNFHFAKYTISAKHNSGKHNTIRYGCVHRETKSMERKT